MTYEETLSFLYSQLPIFQRIGKAAYKSDLLNTLILDDYFGHPHKQFKSIHVAGTNGKGSVSHMLAAVFQKAGYKTGLYTSPHLKDFRERIKINGELISKEFVVEFVEKSEIIISKVQPSFFELTVLMAFDYFAKQHVEFAIIETGMGGRLDSTNIISPILSIITNISFDHMAFLGSDLGHIAEEKAGIIKQNIPLVVGKRHPETDTVFINTCNEKNAKIYFAEDIFQLEYGLETLDNRKLYQINSQGNIVFPDFKVDLMGNYQTENISTCLCTLKVLEETYEINISKMNIYDAFANVKIVTGFQGRWQVVQYNPMVVLDVAHNEDGLKNVLNQVENTPYKKLHIVLGFVNDKDVDTVLQMFPQKAIYYFTQADIPRAMPVENVKEKAEKNELFGLAFLTVKKAYECALWNAEKNDMVIVTGSAFVVAEVP